LPHVQTDFPDGAEARPYRVGMDLAAIGRSMENYLRVHTSAAGFVHIDLVTGNLRWEKEKLDPVMKQYAKKYLVIEGFIELAVGALDPAPDREVKAMLDSILFS
jgi:hypothetical protein